MGGAARNEQRRKQEEASRRLAAAGITPPAPKPKMSPMVIVAAVVGLGVLIGVVVLLLRGSGPAATASYPVAASNGVVTLGKTTPVKIDVYVDYLCPACKAFENGIRNELTTALNDGKVTVRVHPLGLLNANSDPAGYSTRAANAALCAATAGVFPAYNDKLFAEQPSEGGPGLTDDQLIAFGSQVKANDPAAFAKCVRSGPNAQAVGSQTKQAEADPVVAPGGQLGTPAVVVGGKKVNINSSSWLADAIAAG